MKVIVFLAVCSSFFEATTIASIYTFFKTLQNDSFTIHTLTLSYSSALILLIFFVTLSAIFRVANIYIQNNFLQKTRADLSIAIGSVVKQRRFSIRGKINSAELLSSSINEVELFVNYWLLPMVGLFVNTISLAMIFGLLAFLNVNLLLSVVLIVGGFYSFTFLIVKQYQQHLGQKRRLANSKRYEIGGRMFETAPELFINKTSNAIISIYKKHNYDLSTATAQFLTISHVPKIAIEFIMFSALLLYLTFIDPERYADKLPTLIAFMFAGYRALPYSQGIFNALNSLKYSRASQKSLESLLEVTPDALSQGERLADTKFPLTISAYPASSFTKTYPVTFKVSPGDLINISGDSGTGKSLMLESMLGISETFKIELLDNTGCPIDLTSFRNQTSYLRQNSVLFEGTASENISWFSPLSAVHLQRLLDIVRFQQDQANTQIAHLSGGQRQRLLIARTLYVDRQFIIMDEPFTGLDIPSINTILDQIKLKYPNKIIIFTHHGEINRSVIKVTL